jgi:CRISPR system Cascade subunit CasB
MKEVQQTKNVFCERFIANLEALVEKGDLGSLAMLKRGLGKSWVPEAFRFLPFDGGKRLEEAALIIAPLFAFWHQGQENIKHADGNFGSSMRTLVSVMVQEGTDREDAMRRIERRFIALLNCHQEELPSHLRYTVSLLKAKAVPVDWNQLMKDVQAWNNEYRFVQRQWARSFWVSGTSAEEVETISL